MAPSMTTQGSHREDSYGFVQVRAGEDEALGQGVRQINSDKERVRATGKQES